MRNWLLIIPIIISVIALEHSVNGEKSIAAKLINRSEIQKQDDINSNFRSRK